MLGIESGELHISSSSMCPDFVIKKRTICERLFGRPWNPFVTHKNGGELLYLIHNQVYCSPKTYKKIMGQINERRLQNGQR